MPGPGARAAAAAGDSPPSARAKGTAPAASRNSRRVGSRFARASGLVDMQLPLPDPASATHERAILIHASGSRATVDGMARIELAPECRSDGTIVLRASAIGPGERLRRLVRRLLARG